jgi:hypothetical protein
LAYGLLDFSADYTFWRKVMSPAEIVKLLNAETDDSERRVHPRTYVSWRTAIVNKTATANIRMFGKTKSVSATGLCVECEHAIVVLMPVNVVIELPPQMAFVPPKVIQLRAKIRSCILSSGIYRLGMEIIEFQGDAQAEVLKQIRFCGA